MKTTPEALKALYQTLGGSSGNVAGESKTTGILNKIAALFGSTATADKIPDCIDNINAVASGIVKPSGKKSITTTAETDVAEYATAQISDANLVAGNIKKDTTILGITGSYEGGGGSSDFSTATMTIVGGDADVTIPTILDEEGIAMIMNGGVTIMEGQYTIPLYKGKCQIILNIDMNYWTITGDYHDEGDYAYIYGDVTITYTGS